MCYIFRFSLGPLRRSLIIFYHKISFRNQFSRGSHSELREREGEGEEEGEGEGEREREREREREKIN